MKVLHLISSGGMYGAESVILNLCSSLNAGGEHSSVLAVFANTSNPNLQLRDAAVASGIETHDIECRGQFDSSVPSKLRQLVDQTQPDIFHAHGYKADIYGWWGLRKRRVPLISTCHNWLDNDVSLRLYGWLDRTILRRYTKVIAVSAAVKSRLLEAGVPGERLALVRNGIPLKSFARGCGERTGTETGECTVGLVGRLSFEKGVDVFIRAAASVLQSLPSTRFVIAGDGPEREGLQTLIRQLGIEQQVLLLGRQEDMGALYDSLDILVLSSRTEAMPMALLEGMASGLPVIATRVGEIPYVIRDGDNGLLVNVEDPEMLASRIVELLHHAARRRSMGAAATARVSAEFSAESMTQQYLEIYREALASRMADGLSAAAVKP